MHTPVPTQTAQARYDVQQGDFDNVRFWRDKSQKLKEKAQEQKLQFQRWQQQQQRRQQQQQAPRQQQPQQTPAPPQQTPAQASDAYDDKAAAGTEAAHDPGVTLDELQEMEKEAEAGGEEGMDEDALQVMEEVRAMEREFAEGGVVDAVVDAAPLDLEGDA